MRTISLLSFLFLCSCDFSFGKECTDCIVFPSGSEEVIKQHDSITSQKLADFCSDGLSNDKNVQQLCTSGKKKNGNDFELHPNFELLPKHCGIDTTNRILGGEFADLYEFPWMALLSYVTRPRQGEIKYVFKCGGTIITSWYILSAAQCITSELVGVRIGEYDIRKKIDCQGEPPNFFCENNLQDFRIEKSIIHPEYRLRPIIQNDIGLLRTTKLIDFSFRNAQPICLPTPENLRNTSIGGRLGIVAGWGLTETGKTSKILKKIVIPILNNVDCEDLYNGDIENKASGWLDKKFCAGGAERDACKGDSGGPLMLEGEYNNSYRIIQYGIVSVGPRECGASTPGLYTDVTKYLEWILDNIKV